MKHDSIFRRPTTIAMLVIAAVGLFGAARFGSATGIHDAAIPPGPDNQTIGRYALYPFKHTLRLSGSTYQEDRLIRLDTATGRTWYYVDQMSDKEVFIGWVLFESRRDARTTSTEP